MLFDSTYVRYAVDCTICSVGYSERADTMLRVEGPVNSVNLLRRDIHPSVSSFAKISGCFR